MKNSRFKINEELKYSIKAGIVVILIWLFFLVAAIGFSGCSSSMYLDDGPEQVELVEVYGVNIEGIERMGTSKRATFWFHPEIDSVQLQLFHLVNWDQPTRHEVLIYSKTYPAPKDCLGYKKQVCEVQIPINFTDLGRYQLSFLAYQGAQSVNYEYQFEVRK